MSNCTCFDCVLRRSPQSQVTLQAPQPKAIDPKMIEAIEKFYVEDAPDFPLTVPMPKKKSWTKMFSFLRR